MARTPFQIERLLHFVSEQRASLPVSSSLLRRRLQSRRSCLLQCCLVLPPGILSSPEAGEAGLLPTESVASPTLHSRLPLHSPLRICLISLPASLTSPPTLLSRLPPCSPLRIRLVSLPASPASPPTLLSCLPPFSPLPATPVAILSPSLLSLSPSSLPPFSPFLLSFPALPRPARLCLIYGAISIPLLLYDSLRSSRRHSPCFRLRYGKYHP